MAMGAEETLQQSTFNRALTANLVNNDLRSEHKSHSSARFDAARNSTKSPLENALASMNEPRQFIECATIWQGSVTPLVVNRVMFVALYSSLVTLAGTVYPSIALPITPFEYSGVVLALILVLRVNAGHDRWWEARKIWGSVVNQSRNLAIVISAYTKRFDREATAALRWIAVWPHVMRKSLRNERSVDDLVHIIGSQAANRLSRAEHYPVFVGQQLAAHLKSMLDTGLEPMAFLRAETERSQLIDAIGACERIRNTRMPLVLAIKVRRFIALFLIFLPFGLIEQTGYWTPVIAALAAYPLFSLDEIGAELQNPFSPRNVSHLPLNTICASIEKSVLEMLKDDAQSADARN